MCSVIKRRHPEAGEPIRTRDVIGKRRARANPAGKPPSEAAFLFLTFLTAKVDQKEQPQTSLQRLLCFSLTYCFILGEIMSITPKRRCPDPLKDSMDDSMEKRIKRISVEGNIGKDVFHYPAKRGRTKSKTKDNVSGQR